MLEKTYKICGNTVKLKNSAYLFKLYRQMYNRDLIDDTNTVFSSKERTAEYCDIVENLMYCMAFHADETIGTQQDFLESFDSGLFILQAIQPLMDIWVEGCHMTTESSKKKEAQRGRTTARSSS